MADLEFRARRAEVLKAYPALGRHYLHNLAVHAAVDFGVVGEFSDEQIANSAIEALVRESEARLKAAVKAMEEAPLPVFVGEVPHE